MPVSAVLLFLFSILASATLLILALRLKQINNSKSVDFYCYFIVCVVCYGFINWIGPSLLLYFSNSNGQADSIIPVLLFTSSAVPLVLVKLYLFTRTFFSLLQISPTHKLINSFYGICTLILAVFIYLMSLDFSSGSLQTLKPFLQLISILIIIADYIVIAYFLSQTHRLTNKFLQSHARQFGWLYLIAYFIYASPYYLSNWFEIPAYYDFAPYLYYLMHLVPIIAIQKFFKHQHKLNLSSRSNNEQLKQICEKYSISNREKDILEQLLTGKSNKAIADKLCISPNTVRNHIYNIYAKTHVKSRIQLIQLCENRL